MRRALMHRQSAEFLYEMSLFPDVEYTFKHALTHEVAYGSLLQDRRRGLHARIMETIERQYADRLAEQVDRLAHHALRGEVWPKAFTYLRQAGAKPTARSAYREAVTCLEQALAALAHLPESRKTIAQAIDLRLELQSPLFTIGQIQEVIDYLRAAEGLAAALDDRSRLARVLALECSSLKQTFEYDRAIEAGERALAIATDSGQCSLSAVTWSAPVTCYAGLSTRWIPKSRVRRIPAFDMTLKDGREEMHARAAFRRSIGSKRRHSVWGWDGAQLRSSSGRGPG